MTILPRAALALAAAALTLTACAPTPKTAPTPAEVRAAEYGHIAQEMEEICNIATLERIPQPTARVANTHTDISPGGGSYTTTGDIFTHPDRSNPDYSFECTTLPNDDGDLEIWNIEIEEIKISAP